MKIDAVFIDRDGTIGGTDEVVYPGEFQLFPFAGEAIQRLKNEHIKIFSFTNQPGISRGEAKEQEFLEELKDFGFDDVYLCPHQHEEECSCRKPKPEMLYQAARDHGLTLSNCVVIGDRWTDMVAGKEAGCKTLLVMTGAGKDALGKYRAKWNDFNPDLVAKDLAEAVSWLLQEKGANH